MNAIDKYFFLLLVNSTSKNQKVAVLKSINSSQYKILKDITLEILNEIIPLNRIQLKKLSKHKKIIRKLGSNKKISGQVLGKNYSVVIEIIRIGLQHHEISSEVCTSSKRRMGENKSSYKKSKTIGYCKRKEQFISSESSEEFSSAEEEAEEEEEFSSEEFSSEENCNAKSEYSSSGEEFTKESSEREEDTKESQSEESQSEESQSEEKESE